MGIHEAPDGHVPLYPNLKIEMEAVLRLVRRQHHPALSLWSPSE